MEAVVADASPQAQTLVADLLRVTRTGVRNAWLATAGYVLALDATYAWFGTFAAVLLVGILGGSLLPAILQQFDRNIDRALARSRVGCPCGGLVRWQRRGKPFARFWCLSCGDDRFRPPPIEASDHRTQRRKEMRHLLLVLMLVVGTGLGIGIGARSLRGEAALDGVFALGFFTLAASGVLVTVRWLASGFRRWGETLLRTADQAVNSA